MANPIIAFSHKALIPLLCSLDYYLFLFIADPNIVGIISFTALQDCLHPCSENLA